MQEWQSILKVCAREMSVLSGDSSVVSGGIFGFAMLHVALYHHLPFTEGCTFSGNKDSSICFGKILKNSNIFIGNK